MIINVDMKPLYNELLLGYVIINVPCFNYYKK